MEELLDLRTEGVWLVRGGRGSGNSEVEFLLGGVFDVGLEVIEVCWGLEIDFTVVGVHCRMFLSEKWRKREGRDGDSFNGVTSSSVRFAFQISDLAIMFTSCPNDISAIAARHGHGFEITRL